MVEGREELEGKNPYEGQLKKVEYIDIRLQQMDAMGTDVEVLSVGTEQHFPWAEYELARDVAQLQNETLTAVCADYPDRFVPLGVVSLQHPNLAAEQLDHSVKNLGHRGCMIRGNIMGQELSIPNSTRSGPRRRNLMLWFYPSSSVSRLIPTKGSRFPS